MAKSAGSVIGLLLTIAAAACVRLYAPAKFNQLEHWYEQRTGPYACLPGYGDTIVQLYDQDSPVGEPRTARWLPQEHISQLPAAKLPGNKVRIESPEDLRDLGSVSCVSCYSVETADGQHYSLNVVWREPQGDVVGLASWRAGDANQSIAKTLLAKRVH
jgi:hypothetical protein